MGATGTGEPNWPQGKQALGQDSKPLAWAQGVTKQSKTPRKVQLKGDLLRVCKGGGCFAGALQVAGFLTRGFLEERRCVSLGCQVRFIRGSGGRSLSSSFGGLQLLGL